MRPDDAGEDGEVDEDGDHGPQPQRHQPEEAAAAGPARGEAERAVEPVPGGEHGAAVHGADQPHHAAAEDLAADTVRGPGPGVKLLCQILATPLCLANYQVDKIYIY